MNGVSRPGGRSHTAKVYANGVGATASSRFFTVYRGQAAAPTEMRRDSSAAS